MNSRQLTNGLWGRACWYFNTKRVRSLSATEYELKSLNSELQVLKLVEGFEFVKQAFHAVRIPDPNRSRGSGEIDVLALTERGFVLIECKNYRGKVVFHNGDIIQEKLLMQGKKAHIINKLRNKQRNLKLCAISVLQDDAFEVGMLTVFTNPTVELGPEVQNLANVATLENLQAKMWKTIEQRPLLSDEILDKYAKLADVCGSWDSISFPGGKTNIGDIDDSNLPTKWCRTMISMLKVRIVGGLISTMLRGPRIELAAHMRDGTILKEISKPKFEVNHTTPWKSKGIDDLGMYPLEYLDEVSYGHNDSSLEMLDVSRIGTNSKPSVKQQAVAVSTKTESRYYVGKEFKGTVKHHFTDENGEIYALKVSLVERGKYGRLKCKEMANISHQWIPTIYAVGNPINVTIKRINEEGKIELGFVEE